MISVVHVFAGDQYTIRSDELATLGDTGTRQLEATSPAETKRCRKETGKPPIRRALDERTSQRHAVCPTNHNVEVRTVEILLVAPASNLPVPTIRFCSVVYVEPCCHTHDTQTTVTAYSAIN